MWICSTFQAKGKKAQLKVKSQLGHFLYNERDEGWKEADRILGGLGLKYSFLWKPYDPNNFITMRRLKYKLSAYDHCSLPHIEKHANQSKWRRGTLEEAVTQEELNQRALRNLKKMADLEFYSQVSSLPSIQIGAAASSSTAQQQTIKVAGKISEKGKEKEMESEQEQQHQEEQRQEQSAQQKKTVETPQTTERTVPTRQDTAFDASVLQTPQKEDTFVFRKRDRETPLTSSIDQGEKRQRLNDFPEEDIAIREALGMGPPSREASASSFQQEQDRTMGGEVSSSSQQKEGQVSIKQQFIDIKRRSDPIKVQLYNHLLNMAPSNQQRLMSAFDVSEGKLTMSHFMPTALQPQSTADYLRTNLEVLAKDIHPMDKIELHKQTGEMVYASLADKTLENYKLTSSLNATASQLELERASSQAKDNRIRSLEEIIVEIGHNPNDIKGIQEILKLRDADMAALRKKIKFPATIHPHTDEVAKQRYE